MRRRRHTESRTALHRSELWPDDGQTGVRRAKPACCRGRKSPTGKEVRECLEYIVVHEMVHMLEPTHNARFVALMDRLIPQWRVCREQLNQLPVRHEEWTY